MHYRIPLSAFFLSVKNIDIIPGGESKKSTLSNMVTQKTP